MTLGNAACIEIVYGTAQNQVLLKLTIPHGTTIADAIERSGIARIFPDVDFLNMPVGIWGKLADPSHHVAARDRIEFYRPLQIDPRDARRELAAQGRSMGPADSTRR